MLFLQPERLIGPIEHIFIMVNRDHRPAGITPQHQLSQGIIPGLIFQIDSLNQFRTRVVV